jgi:hypothetical protein
MATPPEPSAGRGPDFTGGGAVVEVTVSGIDVVTPPPLTRIVTLQAATPVPRPALLTVAMPLLELDQLSTGLLTTEPDELRVTTLS